MVTLKYDSLVPFENYLSKHPNKVDDFYNLPAEFREASINIFAVLISLKPDVLHCWLDHPNIWGGVAGYLADVPKNLTKHAKCQPKALSLSPFAISSLLLQAAVQTGQYLFC